MSPIDSITSGSVSQNIDQMQEAKPKYDEAKMKALFGQDIAKKFNKINDELKTLKGLYENLHSQDANTVANNTASVLESLDGAFKAIQIDDGDLSPEQAKLFADMKKHYNEALANAVNIAQKMSVLESQMQADNEKIRAQLKG
ncbi:hypothetical protein D5018_00710 [Parashewanella curva]|uniref:Uncharacterized protein n=1 Tax=Parashewanella curva TaxID=2338552 RepID=A0A3L8Q3W4_9GAMM|nr:hypothetical protein [Parashewanella curva]RLV61672.1 hypothetical protein D5018_00710 [Parashewanella curva]